ncbi:hypothetical protein AAX26_00682 [Aliarcobacter thereius]|uniref:Uncharacterized protein n=2 Tax=Aliarcobacter thereius TaxID=544718 RepID=A0A1C0B8F8_9BACT|nr:hypothetical protein [Aliarcobacter thereius]OCL87594.1 hypothetical protein AAX26_00682 [Aliarcobacter thereius]OCL93838.1 hypothetical protein AAX25_00160 [Aliarcobacter thereius]OCL95246.1 hypothetical protein AA347_00700 [Aliarcobacter thereius LMG 24486]OCL99863.1 hypothetical protein AAX29_00913 [Aliarcobacter thereius]QBF16764.1 hypothetical protein ATH_1744 [Aliarcobacter thereius LMG 24486]
MNYQTRKLPKRSVIMISILIVLGIFVFYTMQTLKNEKFKQVLEQLDHKDISALKVVNRMNVEDTITKRKSYVYKLVFHDNTLNKDCIGFIYQQNDKTYTKDIDCK